MRGLLGNPLVPSCLWHLFGPKAGFPVSLVWPKKCPKVIVCNTFLLIPSVLENQFWDQTNVTNNNFRTFFWSQNWFPNTLGMSKKVLQTITFGHFFGHARLAGKPSCSLLFVTFVAIGPIQIKVHGTTYSEHESKSLAAITIGATKVKHSHRTK